MTPEQGSEIAGMAVLAGWAKHKKDQQKPALGDQKGSDH